MNIFFYGGTPEKREQQFAEKLLERSFFSEMAILPGGGELLSTQSLELRCGDLLILCAATDDSLNALLSIHEKFDDFRIILVLPRQDDDLLKKSHLLRPRYVMSMACDLAELDSVVERINLLNKESESIGEKS